MQIACVDGIADLARATTSAEAAAAYQGEPMTFGADYLIPKPFDPRLSASFVRRRQGRDGNGRGRAPDRGSGRLQDQARRVGLQIRPAHAPGFRGRRNGPRRIVFAEGEDERVLRAAQAILEETTERRS